MEELKNIIDKYQRDVIPRDLTTPAQLNLFALGFYRDVAEVYDIVTRIKNIERNPSGFNQNDAPILGLLVRVWKLLKETIRYYEADNAEIIGILDRPMLEAAVVANYLLLSDDSVITDYRKCSFKTAYEFSAI